MALNYDAVSALVRKKYIPELVDNYFDAHPLANALRARGAFVPWTDGGDTIVEPLIDGKLSNGGSYGNYDTLTYDQTTPITAAKYDFKSLVQPIIISHQEEQQVSGENAVMTLLRAKMEVARLTFEDIFADQLWGDGTGNSSKDLTGLGATLSATSTYGGIAVADMATWKATVVTGTTAGTNEPISDLRMINTWTKAIKGSDHPDLAVAGRKVYSAIWNWLQGKVEQHSATTQRMVDRGFEAIQWHGVPIVLDSSMNDASDPFPNALVWLNTKYLKIRPATAATFEITPWRQADNMVAQKCEILWDGNITCSNRARQAILEDIDTTGF